MRYVDAANTALLQHRDRGEPQHAASRFLSSSAFVWGTRLALPFIVCPPFVTCGVAVRQTLARRAVDRTYLDPIRQAAFQAQVPRQSRDMVACILKLPLRVESL